MTRWHRQIEHIKTGVCWTGWGWCTQLVNDLGSVISRPCNSLASVYHVCYTTHLLQQRHHSLLFYRTVSVKCTVPMPLDVKSLGRFMFFQSYHHFCKALCSWFHTTINMGIFPIKQHNKKILFCCFTLLQKQLFFNNL